MPLKATSAQLATPIGALAEDFSLSTLKTSRFSSTAEVVRVRSLESGLVQNEMISAIPGFSSKSFLFFRLKQSRICSRNSERLLIADGYTSFHSEKFLPVGGPDP